MKQKEERCDFQSLNHLRQENKQTMKFMIQKHIYTYATQHNRSSLLTKLTTAEMEIRVEIPLSFFLILSFLTPQISAGGQFPINVWPKPTVFTWPLPQATLLSPNFTVSFRSHHYLQAAVLRYLHLFLNESYRPLVPPPLNLTSSPAIGSLRIIVSDIDSPLTHGVNESYTLTIPSPNSSISNESTIAVMTAETAWGAMRGLETFSQLIYGNPARIASGVYIKDEPLFMHRGVMLDTGRNYYGVEEVLRLIKAISMNKLNVFHWHITDSHSFPLVLASEPELARKGAYGEEMTYTADDVKKVVEFGMECGVRVVPEIDMPGEYLKECSIFLHQIRILLCYHARIVLVINLVSGFVSFYVLFFIKSLFY